MNAQPNLGMQVTTFENPMGIDGFEFVEFAAPAGRAGELHTLFRKMGFTAVLKHRRRAITVYRQGGVNFLVNEDPDSFAADFAAAHGPCACGFGIGLRTPSRSGMATSTRHWRHAPAGLSRGWSQNRGMAMPMSSAARITRVPLGTSVRMPSIVTSKSGTS